MRCWAFETKDRPTFSELVAALGTMKDSEAGGGVGEVGQGIQEGRARAAGQGGRHEGTVRGRKDGGRANLEGGSNRAANAFQKKIAGLQKKSDVKAILQGMGEHAGHAGVQERGCLALLDLSSNDLIRAKMDGMDRCCSLVQDAISAANATHFAKEKGRQLLALLKKRKRS